MMCTGENDIEELSEMYGPLCWQGYDRGSGGIKKLMWYGSMKEFNCKATSAWSKCGRTKETAFTHRHLSPEKEEEASQLDFFIGTGRRDDDVYICNDVRTWDHYAICARIQDEEQTTNLCERKGEEEVDRMETKDRRAKTRIQEECDGKVR